jgi:hypothetical protein
MPSIYISPDRFFSTLLTLTQRLTITVFSDHARVETLIARRHQLGLPVGDFQ